MKRAMCGLAFLAAAAGWSQPAAAGPEEYVGEMMIVGYSGWCPRGSMPASGQLLPIASNQVLFSLLGTKFGGDGRSNFALPKANETTLQGLHGAGLPPGLYYCVVTQGVYPSRN
ncbi:MAG: phage tail protein [Alphaproteobacteria bacterium]